VTSGFRGEVVENCAPLNYYASSSSSCEFLNHENGTGSLSRNVGKKFPLLDV